MFAQAALEHHNASALRAVGKAGCAGGPLGGRDLQAQNFAPTANGLLLSHLVQFGSVATASRGVLGCGRGSGAGDVRVDFKSGETGVAYNPF